MPKAQPTERHLITPAETKAIAEAVGAKLSPSIYIAAVLGLRWGELHALRVNRLDLDAGYLTVTATITRGPQGEPVEGEPKSRRGNRTQSIPPRLVQILTEHITAQELGLTPTVPDRQGGLVRYSNLHRRAWQPALIAAGLGGVQPALGFHDFRRLTATQLAQIADP